MQRRFEQFNCGKCDEVVVPLTSGTRNHCNHCLHSAHMDADEPGDRASECRGLMEPIGLELRHGVYTILHRCVDCGHERTNKSVKDDSVAAIMELAMMCAQDALNDKHNRPQHRSHKREHRSRR
jgi:DNA-directed RNA polymerase subunit RPC12/RpoP